MKKFALAAVAAAALTGGVAQAYTVGSFSNGFVVPNVIHNGAANTTAVGIVNQSTGTIPVFWTFFDQNSNHGVDGCFGMTAKQYTGFNWAAVSGVGMENKRGYLVFAVGIPAGGATAANVCTGATQTLAPVAATAQIAGNAFYVDVAGKSVAYTPVIDGPLVLAGGTNLTTMGPFSLQRVAGAAAVLGGAGGAAITSPEPALIPAAAGVNVNAFGRANTTQLSLRYFIDGAAGGNDTRITVWSTGNHKGTHTVNIYDNAQNRQSVNFVLAENELSWFDPESISGRPAAFTDGFIEWNPSVLPSDAPVATASVEGPIAAIGGDVVAYSTIIAPAFGAVQTLLGAHR
ncbi:hypothetical protein [Acidovorax sp.]|uniref:hypothetical protein n=1 Tax=Acidovorax sp. TaxID=1872122 RepID=UPI0025C422EF|nr:hypothetical protein [Acidovorax sp.]MBL7088005.1 hypothetical protein [Acidovorax sp.]